MKTTEQLKDIITEISNMETFHTEKLDAYPVKTIIDFLKISHQRFTNESIPRIEQNFMVLLKSYEENHRLQLLFQLFLKFQVDLNRHIKIEEKTLFPYAGTLYKASISSSLPALLLIHFGNYSVSDFANSHEGNECYLTEIIYLMERRHELKSHPVYNILLKQLNQMNNELKTHGWVEDHVLVKKVTEIEKAITQFVGNIEN